MIAVASGTTKPSSSSNFLASCARDGSNEIHEDLGLVSGGSECVAPREACENQTRLRRVETEAPDGRA